jgi:hypothetical protein
MFIHLVPGNDAFRDFSNQINNTLIDLKKEVSNYHDQSRAGYFLQQISDLDSEMTELCDTFFTNSFESNIRLLLNIDARNVKLHSEWEAFKRERPSKK